MITKEITLCGKQVTLAYCFATEISYKILSDEEVSDFTVEVIAAIQNKRMPDVRKSIFLILAAMQAYYEPGEPPIKDADLMKDAAPEELATALGIIIGLRAEFYHVPKGELEEKKKDDDEKNV